MIMINITTKDNKTTLLILLVNYGNNMIMRIMMQHNGTAI